MNEPNIGTLLSKTSEHATHAGIATSMNYVCKSHVVCPGLETCAPNNKNCATRCHHGPSLTKGDPPAEVAFDESSADVTLILRA